MKDFVMDIARQAGSMALEFMEDLDISMKAEKSVVTQADVAIENYITEKIREAYPGHDIVGEEKEVDVSGNEYTWYIDPIDGTVNYSHGDPHFAVSIAVARDGIPVIGVVYQPMTDDMFVAQKGKGAYLNGKPIRVSQISELKKAFSQVGISPLKHSIDKSLDMYKYFMLNTDRARDYGFCAGQLALVSGGMADAFVKFSQQPWDVAAGILLVQEAGGKATDTHGDTIRLSPDKRFNVIASNGVLHEQLLEAVKEFKSKEKWY